MVLPDADRVRSLLAEAVTILCKNTINYQAEFQIEGLLGITVDRKDIFLVNINENVHGKSNTVTAPEVPEPNYLPVPGSIPIPPRPRSVARPYQARSPFVPNRIGFGTRARYRGRGRGIRISRSSVNEGNNARDSVGEPPHKKHQRVPPIESTVDLTDNDDSEVKDSSDAQLSSENRNNAQNGANDNAHSESTDRVNDPLTSLDFGDMMQQYEDTGGGGVKENEEEGDQEQSPEQTEDDSTEKEAEETSDNAKPVIIKPERETDHESQSMQSTDALLPGGSGSLEAVAVTDPNVPFLMGDIGQDFSGQSFMDPNMPGCSTWPQQGAPPVPVSIHPHQMPSLPPPHTFPQPQSHRPSPARSRFNAKTSPQASGQGSQKAEYICHLCYKSFTRGSNLKLHIRTVHEQSLNYPCKLCSNVYTHPSSLRRNVRFEHKKNAKMTENRQTNQEKEYEQIDQGIEHRQFDPAIFGIVKQEPAGEDSTDESFNF